MILIAYEAFAQALTLSGNLPGDDAGIWFFHW